jgi:hypothetical protein
MMKANLVTEIDAFSNEFIFVTTLNLWFSKININLRDDINYSDLNDEDDEDCESDKENIDSSTSNIGVECSELDLCESEKQTHFLNQTCNCERLYNKVSLSVFFLHQHLCYCFCEQIIN